MDQPGTLCIGHRGAMGHAPENTLLSFKKALELGTPCVETDVYYVDNHLMVFHDDRLDRTTNGSGYLMDHSFEALRFLEFIDRRFVADAHLRGLRVFVFTVNHPEDIERMEGLGVDGVFTNYPERVLSRQKTKKVIGWI